MVSVLCLYLSQKASKVAVSDNAKDSLLGLINWSQFGCCKDKLIAALLPDTARSTALAAGCCLPQAPYVGTKSMKKRKICARKGLTQRNRSLLSSQKLYWDLYWEPHLNAEVAVIPHTSCSCSIAKWCVYSILLLFYLLLGFSFKSLFLWGVLALWCGVFFQFLLKPLFQES